MTTTTDDGMETASYNLSVDDGDSETYRTTPSNARPSPLGRFVRGVRGVKDDDEDDDGVVESSGRSRVVRWIARGVKVVVCAVFGLYLVGLAASGEETEEEDGEGASVVETRRVMSEEARERRAMQTAAEAPTHPRVAYVPQAKSRRT